MFSRNINCCFGGCLFAFILTQNLGYTNSVFLPLEVITVFIKKHTWNNCLSFPDSLVGKESACNAGDPDLIPGSGRWAGEGIDYSLQQCKDCEIWTSLVAQLVQNPVQYGRPGFHPWVGKVPWGMGKLPTPVFWPGEFLDCVVHGATKSQTCLSNFHSLH